tara:strand:+ start:294 stop:452 length:159 start_codon:yes stop_codon:yes gene_type:complete
MNHPSNPFTLKRQQLNRKRGRLFHRLNVFAGISAHQRIPHWKQKKRFCGKER